MAIAQMVVVMGSNTNINEPLSKYKGFMLINYKIYCIHSFFYRSIAYFLYPILHHSTCQINIFHFCNTEILDVVSHMTCLGYTLGRKIVCDIRSKFTVYVGCL